MRRNSVFKENNNLVLSGKEYLESFLVGALSVGALHAKSTAIGLSTDVIGSLYKMKNSKGQHLPNETVKAYLSNNATDADIQKIDTWGKEVKAEDIDKMTDDIGRIASAKIGGPTYGDISKATAKMNKGQTIDFLYEVMNSPEYKSQTEEMKKQSAVAMDEGEGVKVGNTSDNINRNNEIIDNIQDKKEPADENVNTSKINDYNANDKANVNNEDKQNFFSNDIDISEANTVSQNGNEGNNINSKTNQSIINQEDQNIATGNENGIANSDEMGYKGGEGNLYTKDAEIPKAIIKTKPMYSRMPKSWLGIGGKISIDKNNTWTYISPQGVSVKYINGYPDFKNSGHVKQEVDIGEFKNRPDDFKRADKLAPNGPKSPKNTWHHNEDGKTMQEINTRLHKMFTHQGGISNMKKGRK